jgi:FtsH-binding integral membrane protein
MTYEPSRSDAVAGTAGRSVDAGLQAFMRGVYNTMGLGLVVTGLVAFATAQSQTLLNLIFGTPLKWVVILAPLGFLMFGFTPGRLARMPAAQLRTMFYGFSALMGLSLSTLFLAYTAESLARVFFITAATFAATSLYGYTAKRDLSGIGAFLFMGLIGIVIASVVNLFVQSSMVGFVVSVIGVLVFTGLTAWETQRLKETYSYGAGMAEANDKLAVMGALSLYLNFINLLQSLLALMGNRR